MVVVVAVNKKNDHARFHNRHHLHALVTRYCNLLSQHKSLISNIIIGSNASTTAVILKFSTFLSLRVAYLFKANWQSSLNRPSNQHFVPLVQRNVCVAISKLIVYQVRHFKQHLSTRKTS